MSTQSLTGRWALVTGASSGLGIDFARELAGRGCNVVLVARREDQLLKVKEELEQRYQIKARVEVFDLTDRTAPEQLYQRLKADGIAIDVLVNNAGLGIYGPYMEIAWEREHAMLELDIVTLAHMTKLFVPEMVKRGFGYIMQIGSIASYQPSPLYTSYAASKAFVLSYGEGLNYELRGTGVSCTVLCPGVTATEFLQTAGQEPTLYQRFAMMRSDEVARIGIAAMLKRRPSIVSGWLNAATIFLNRLMPRTMAAAIAYRVMK